MSDETWSMGDTRRDIGRAPGGRTLTLRRTYPAAIEDVWDACTTPERLGRFFAPVSGDLREGGRFQIQGNAGGDILECDPPRLLRVTWAFGDRPPSEVRLRLLDEGPERTVLELEHAPVSDTVELAGRQVDPVLNDPETGIWGMGTGWEMGFIALDSYLRGVFPDEPPAPDSPELIALADRCGKEWAAAVARSNTAG